MNILKNEYPYTNKKHVNALLESIIQLQKDQSKAEYLISPKTFEDITCTATKKGHSHTVLLVWEYLKLIHGILEENNEPHAALYKRPSPGLYENAATVFAASGYQDQLIFSTLSEMENEGYKPARPFISRLAATLRTRSTVKRLDNALHMIREAYDNDESNGESSLIPTTSALNTIVAAFSDLGFSAKAMDIYHSFESLGCTPDEDTYSFLMDSIAMDVTTTIPPMIKGSRRRTKGIIEDVDMKSWLNTQIEAADAIFETATELGYGSNEHMTNAYVKILCAIGELDKAMYLLDEKICNGENIPQASLGMVALSNAELGDFEIVDDIISMGVQAGYRNGLSKHFLERIDNLKNIKY
jgi:pentatricopeptide repeat protein